jgi:cytidylate kinase
MLKRLAVEFFGTYLLVIAATGVIITREVPFIGIAASPAIAVMIMILVLGHFSDVHLNPAVSLAFLVLKKISLKFVLNPQNRNNEIWLNEENVEYLIRDMHIAQRVSEVAALKSVREFAVAQQQLIGANKGIVMDGRDIGTAVFPLAELKIFMTADVSVRVYRRFKELIVKNPNITLEEVKANLEGRDYTDSNRAISPLRKADDAITLDNSELTPKEQLELALNWAKQKIND